MCPRSWAAAFATWPRLRPGSRRVSPGLFWVRSRSKTPIWCVEAAREAFPGKVAVGIDARNGLVATKGWAEETDVQVTDLARSFEDAGVAAIIYTDINRDGAMQGPNIEATADLARAVSQSR